MTRDLGLALKLMEVLKNEEHPQKIGDLAIDFGCSEDFLHQVSNKLKKANLIKAKRGVGGGILRKSNEDISVWLVFKALNKTKPKKSISNKEDRIVEKISNLLNEELI